MPLTADDPLPDLEKRLVALHGLGPAEFEPGERQQIMAQLKELKRVSFVAMAEIDGSRR